MNKLIFVGLPALLSFFNCQNPQANTLTTNAIKTHEITHFNLIFAPDLSSRMDQTRYRRPLNDVEILSIIAGNLYPSILRCRRSENQLDKLRVDFINKGLINQYQVHSDKLLIDFGAFQNQNDRISYIMERNGSKETLRRDTSELVTEFGRIITLAGKQHFGADIWTYFNEGINNKQVLASESPIIYKGENYINTYRNILVLITDGYIEAGIYNKGFDLSKSTVERFRRAFLTSKESDIAEFLRKNIKYQINPVKNENLKNLEILVMELYDRSLSKDGAATVHPTDMEIIRVLWTDWLEKSKVKRFELHSIADSRYDAENIVFNFMGIKKVYLQTSPLNSSFK